MTSATRESPSRRPAEHALCGMSVCSEFDLPVGQGQVHDVVRRQLAVEPLMVRPEDQARHTRVRNAGFQFPERRVLL